MTPQINSNLDNPNSTFIIPNQVISGNYITFNVNSYFEQKLCFYASVKTNKITVCLKKRNDIQPQIDIGNLNWSFIMKIKYC